MRPPCIFLVAFVGATTNSYLPQTAVAAVPTPTLCHLHKRPPSPARYPCGLMQGDDKAKATVDAMISGLLKDVSKYSLEKGVASSVLANRKDLIRQVWCVCGRAGRHLIFLHTGIRVSPIRVLLCCP